MLLRSLTDILRRQRAHSSHCCSAPPKNSSSGPLQPAASLSSRSPVLIQIPVEPRACTGGNLPKVPLMHNNSAVQRGLSQAKSGRPKYLFLTSKMMNPSHLEMFLDTEAISQRHFDCAHFICWPRSCRTNEGKLARSSCCSFAAGQPRFEQCESYF